jgi:hypothetical protein
VTVPTTRLVETLEMWHTLVLLAGFVASQRFPSGSSGSVATLNSAAWVLFAGGPVARWRIGDAPLLPVACAMNVYTSHQTYKLVSICYCLHAKGSSAPDCARDPTTCHKPHLHEPLSLHTNHTILTHVPSNSMPSSVPGTLLPAVLAARVPSPKAAMARACRRLG